MNVKTAHKGYPKDELLTKLGYDKKTKLCPKPRRGESYGYSRTYDLGGGDTCTVLAAGHNSKKPVLVVSTASTMTAADDYTKTWTIFNAVGEMVKYTIRVATTMVHALYHRYYGVVDVHNHLRQGVVSFAEAWPTKEWSTRHFAEGLGFWEVNVYKAVGKWGHDDYQRIGHVTFRKRLAHAFLTLGKVPYPGRQGEGGAGASSSAEHYHKLVRFKNYDDEHHKCGFCPAQSYFYCGTCFPDGRPTHAVCNPTKNANCLAKHLAGEKPVHGCRVQIAKKADRHSPRQAARRAREEETAREQDAAPDSGAHVARRRRIVTG